MRMDNLNIIPARTCDEGNLMRVLREPEDRSIRGWKGVIQNTRTDMSHISGI